MPQQQQMDGGGGPDLMAMYHALPLGDKYPLMKAMEQNAGNGRDPMDVLRQRFSPLVIKQAPQGQVGTPAVRG